MSNYYNIHTGSSIKPFALFVDSSSSSTSGSAAAFRRPRPVSVDYDDDDSNQQQQPANQRISVHVTMRSKQQPRPSYRWQTKGARGELVGLSSPECLHAKRPRNVEITSRLVRAIPTHSPQWVPRALTCVMCARHAAAVAARASADDSGEEYPHTNRF